MFRKSREFKTFLENNWQELYKVAYAWSSDPALSADLAQEAITRALQNGSKIQDAEHLKLWLFKVLRNCWLDHLRRQKDNVDIQDTPLSSDLDMDQEIYHKQLLTKVMQAFQKLSLEHREILSLIVLEGMSYEATAEILSIPAGTVMSRISRARSSLKQQIKQIEKGVKDSPMIWRVK